MFNPTSLSMRGNAGNVFKDADDMRKDMMRDIESLGYDVRDFYKEDGPPRSDALLTHIILFCILTKESTQIEQGARPGT